MLGENSIQVRGLLNYNAFPVKVYPFAAEFDKLYRPVITPPKFLDEITYCLARNPGVLEDQNTKRSYEYGISFPWGFIRNGEFVRNVDLYCFEFDSDFKTCNPEWNAYVFRNGILQPNSTKGCGTGLIILGKEEELRRRMVDENKTFEDYLNSWPDLGCFGPLNQDIIKMTRYVCQR